MEKDYQRLEFEYVSSPDQAAPEPVRHPVIVVGAGPVGFATAIDLARQGVPVVMLDDDNRLSSGSRAICFAKRTLEIFDRLGCGERMVRKGVSWNVGKVFFQDELVYTFNLLPESGHHRPAFINLQQYYVEGYLHEHALAHKNLVLRWKNKVVGIDQKRDRVEVTVETPEGRHQLRCDYLIACDGARSPIRNMLGQESKGRVFRDRFLIADVKMKADFPAERWFWFDPPFHRNQSVLLHMQPDNVWRIDFQLGWDANPEEEKKPEKVIPRVKALLGEHAQFDFEWVSVYTFACRRMDAFRHRRVLFAGDSAHGVSPFGARGANSGVQDAENIAWKLRLVLQGKAPDRLLDTYATEREYAADENILNSTRATDFITPKSEVSRTFRDAMLKLAKRPSVRSPPGEHRAGCRCPRRLSAQCSTRRTDDVFSGAMVPGAPSADAPVRKGRSADWFLQQIGSEFTVFSAGPGLASELATAMGGLAQGAIPVKPVVVVPAGEAAAAAHGMTVVEDARRRARAAL